MPSNNTVDYQKKKSNSCHRSLTQTSSNDDDWLLQERLQKGGIIAMISLTWHVRGISIYFRFIKFPCVSSYCEICNRGRYHWSHISSFLLLVIFLDTSPVVPHNFPSTSTTYSCGPFSCHNFCDFSTSCVKKLTSKEIILVILDFMLSIPNWVDGWVFVFTRNKCALLYGYAWLKGTRKK